MTSLEGPGRYGDIAEVVFKETKAQVLLLIIEGGFRGHGFSVVSRDKQITSRMPKILRRMADEIEKQTKDAANS